MNKKAIKTFAITARNKLREEVIYQMQLIGILKNNDLKPSQKDSEREIYDIGGSKPKILYKKEILQRKNLIKIVDEKGYDNVVEEVAYTWFNRIIAVRFMEVNDYLPSKIRVLSSNRENKLEPDIVTEAPNINLNFDENEISKIYSLKNENKLDDLFQFLFLKQCNELNSILPELFEKTEDYHELLLSLSFTNDDGIVRELIKTIPEENFKNQVEIIGWLYQYYISELNELIYDGTFKKNKLVKELIPPATQLFTPDWPIKYMVENSLGQLWLDSNPNDEIRENWKFYIQNPTNKNNQNNLDPTNIKVFDPCMGSGHILSYAFDVLIEIYKSCGYNERNATELILKNNLYGTDIDERAYQLAYFSILMKARRYDRKILNKNISLNISSINESNEIFDDLKKFKNLNNLISEDLNYILNIFLNAKEYGSILNIKPLDFKKLYNNLENIRLKISTTLDETLFTNLYDNIYLLIKQAEILTKKYDVVFTNPPYLNSNRFNSKLLKYAKQNFPDSHKDFSTIFYQKSIESFCKEGGYISFITTNSWMFLKTFEKIRKKIVNTIQIKSIVDFGSELFEGKIGHNLIISWVNKNELPKDELIAIKLSEFNYSKRDEKKQEFFNAKNRYVKFQNDFLEIPGSPISYWVDDKFINAFKNGKNLSTFADVKQGLATADNKKFLRLWYEVDINNIGFGMSDFTQAKNSGKKWFPYNKGGSFRKWYGNQEYLINYKNDGEELKNFKPSVLRNTSFYFRDSLSWSKISSGNIAFRFFQNGFLFDVAGCSIFTNEDKMYLLGFLNSKVSGNILGLISPTLNYEVGHISSLPIILSEDKLDKVKNIVEENINLSKAEWNSFETSWDFRKHPFMQSDKKLLLEAYDEWNEISESNFYKLMENENKLNEIFIEIYSLKKNSITEIDESNIALRKANLERDIKSFLSYFIGCLMGRHSLDEEGFVFSGGKYNPSKYSKFIPDEDNIVPILDTEYFGDDIMKNFTEFLKTTFSKETLEENIKFIADALGNKGNTYRDTIRKYFLNDFYKDHVKAYKKTPIYWMFSSGKENGFNSLIYLHRYTPDTVARIRTEYLHKTQKALETTINNNEQIIINSSNQKEKNEATKENIKLKKQLDETVQYDEALAHIANKQIDLDLDYGVKVNYAKFQGVEIANKKIDLLKKI